MKNLPATQTVPMDIDMSSEEDFTVRVEVTHHVDITIKPKIFFDKMMIRDVKMSFNDHIKHIAANTPNLNLFMYLYGRKEGFQYGITQVVPHEKLIKILGEK